MKKSLVYLTPVLLVLALLMGSCPQYAHAEEYVEFSNKNVKDADNIVIYVEGRPVDFDSPVKVSEGRTLVPLRKIVESLGFVVDYNPETKVVLIKSEKLKSQVLSISFVIGSNFVTLEDYEYVGEVSLALEVVPEIYHNRTYVPLRTLAELCEARVKWDPESGRIDINSSDKTNLTGEWEVKGDYNSALYKGVLINGLPEGFGAVLFGEGNFYKGQWKAGLPDGSGIMKWSADEGTFVIMGQFQNGRLVDGTIVGDYGYSVMRKSEVIASYAAAGAGFIALPADKSFNSAWQERLVAVIPKIKR